MSIRKQPRLANWLLDRFGLANQNPPLTGDLLEEFRNGRSSAWFWRQTLVAISALLLRSARLCRWSLAGAVIGWAAQAVIAFVLWRSHFPPHLPAVFGYIASTAILIHLFRRLRRAFRRKPPVAEEALVPAETVAWTYEPQDEGDLVAAMCLSFTGFLVGYCVWALLWEMAAWVFFIVELEFFLVAVKIVLEPDDPSPVQTP